jgi:segregation and condensation protein B
MVKRTDQNQEPPQPAPPPSDDDEAFEGLSLEELGQAYADAIAKADAEARAEAEAWTTKNHRPSAEPASSPASSPAPTITSPTPREPSPTERLGTPDPGEPSGGTADDDEPADDDNAVDEDEGSPPSPLAIIEAALFIGNPENRALTDTELAGLMRGVTTEDVQRYVDELNASYVANSQAIRIHRDEDGFRMGVAPDMEVIRRAFYGKIRESRLSQAAIEVLSLVAYQPGITAEKVQDQRGKESGSLLSQLVRRRLLEQRRVPEPGGKKAIAVYFPTERFLQLFQLRSLDDLPHVEA